MSIRSGFSGAIGALLAIICVMFVGSAVLVGGCSLMAVGVSQSLVENERKAKEIRARESAAATPQEPTIETPAPGTSGLPDPVVVGAGDVPASVVEPDTTTEPEPLAVAGDPSGSEPPASPAPVGGDGDDPAAEAALNLARKLRTKNPEAYRRRLQDIVAKHPNTQAASDASRELALSQ